MATELIKDKSNQTIALLKTEGNYTVLTTPTGKLLGRYNKVSNVTLDASNNVFAPGNQVMRLLK